MKRTSGVLLHLSSLPSPLHSGDLGAGAKQFVDFLNDTGQTYWQMLPVNPIGLGNSPYSSICSFAGEPLFIEPQSVDQKTKPYRQVNYERSKKSRHKLLRNQFSHLNVKQFSKRKDFTSFCNKQRYWLDDFALFLALSKDFGSTHWHLWPKALRNRNKDALNRAKKELHDEIVYIKYQQYLFQTQWNSLKSYCQKRQVKLIGDLPIFVAHDSADVWAHQNAFFLAKDRSCKFVAGCPPDAFNKNGQLWGNALYNWPALKKQGYSYWMDKLKRSTEMFDLLRLDHFIGFHRYWKIPANSKSAKNGSFAPGGRHDFFKTVKRNFPKMPFFAEDLGKMVPAVHNLRDEFGFAGMKILQFGFGNDTEAPLHMPHNYPKNSVAYTGTHDNDTILGWFATLPKQKKQLVLDYFCVDRLHNLSWSCIAATLQSRADLAIVPLQDLLVQSSDFRMNTPGIANGNWRYTFQFKQLNKKMRIRLKNLTLQSGRA